MKPVRLPASATLALPRWGLIALCLLYILPGLIRRDPWKSDDAAGFGIMWTMARGTWQDWLWPHVAGLPAPGEGPLAFWLGALFIRLFGWLLGDALAARISTIGFFLIGALSVWYSTYLLGRRSETQPLRLAFGGQPEARDYGRTLADGALLIYLACLGLLLRSHETTAEALQVSMIGFAIYSAVRLFESQSLRSAMVLGVTLGLLVLTRGWLVPIAFWSALVLVSSRHGGRLLQRLALVTLPLGFATAGIWPLLNALMQPFGGNPTHAWLQWNAAQLALPSLQSVAYFFKYIPWFAWPAWPFAAWAVYAWRQQRGALHVTLPLGLIIAFILLVLLHPHGEESFLLPLLPPLSILAAFGLPTMKRGAINAVDWFAMMTLSTCAAFIWIGWIAKQTGWPPRLAHNALKLAPGFKPEFNLLAFLIAAAATIAWILVIRWRIARHPSVLWRAVVLSSGGVILCWLLLMTLWLPWLNYGKSYAGVGKQIGARLPSADYCVDTNVGAAQRASFAYFGGVEFARFDRHDCAYLLLQDRGSDPLMKKDEDGRLVLLWEGRRPSDRDERFRLYRRVKQ
jgi:4-amino-4-deoxy-L-arabinose transferase-like glycosyltransferase